MKNETAVSQFVIDEFIIAEECQTPFFFFFIEKNDSSLSSEYSSTLLLAQKGK